MHITAKQYEMLQEDLATNLAVDFFEDDEVDAVLQDIEAYDADIRQKVLALALSFSEASSSLIPGLLTRVRIASRVLSLQDLERWIDAAFDLRDSAGIDQALRFLSRVDELHLRRAHGREGVSLEEAAPLLETYLRALSGRELKIMPGEQTCTDTVNIFLPGTVGRFRQRDLNFSLYKLAAANSWAQIELGTLSAGSEGAAPGADVQAAPGRAPIEILFSRFEDRRLALDLYTVIESFRAEYFLMQELPGLMKQAAAIKQDIYRERISLSLLSGQSAFVEGLWQYYLAGKSKGPSAKETTWAVSSLYSVQYETDPKQSHELLFELYETARSLSGAYSSRPAPFFVSRIIPEKVTDLLRETRAGRMRNLEGAIANLFRVPDLGGQERRTKKRPSGEAPLDPSRDYVLIKGKIIRADDDLKKYVTETGGIPGLTLVKGSEIGGGSPLTLRDLLDEEEEADAGQQGIKYDEWDYRRRGYRKEWCTLSEHPVLLGKEPFVELTLKRYGSAVQNIRKKFELLRRERRISRRQKDGDEIDIDAAVEAFSDMRAGVTPSDNVYARIERQERSIAVLFLIDMSGSTRGWVNRAEKESLVLMSEALETLGDRYAIYGFSGATRNNCELFRVKGFDEAYTRTVKRRIAGIEPRDYTRMGPFIRHAANLLLRVEARTRLLVTLSDSRPEDWDSYKGEYAIEDTRKALIEAASRGIHPFCITIDRQAQSYLPHLFGEVNYIFIDDVRKLPSRITEIYCRLTA